MKKAMDVSETVSIIVISMIVLLVVGTMLRQSEAGARDSQNVVETTKLCMELCEQDSFKVDEVKISEDSCELGLAPRFCERGCLKYANCILTDRQGKSCSVSTHTCLE